MIKPKQKLYACKINNLTLLFKNFHTTNVHRRSSVSRIFFLWFKETNCMKPMHQEKIMHIDHKYLDHISTEYIKRQNAPVHRVIKHKSITILKAQSYFLKYCILYELYLVDQVLLEILARILPEQFTRPCLLVCCFIIHIFCAYSQ